MKLASLLVGIVFLANSTLGAIDFTPATGERKLNGIKFQHLTFTHEGKKITYEQPRGWRYNGGGGSIKFTPPDLAQAEAEIDQTPLPAPQKLDEETVKKLEAQVMASVPKDSKNVTLISAETNPFRINNNETYAVLISYSAFGEEFQRWALFMNLTDTQVRFRITARKADFEKLQKAFRASIFSWQWH